MVFSDNTRITTGQFGATCHFAIVAKVSYNDYVPVALCFYDRSKQTINAIGAYMKSGRKEAGHSLILNGYEAGTMRSFRVNLNIHKDRDYSEFDVWSAPFSYARDRGTMGLALSHGIGTHFVITTRERADEDLYSALMKDHTLPLQREWMPYLRMMLRQYGAVEENIKVYGAEGATLKCGIEDREGKAVSLEDVIGYTVEVSEETLERVVSEGLRRGLIKFSEKPQNPLDLGQKDENGKGELNVYMETYGQALNANVDKVILPLTNLKPTVDGYAGKSTRIYPQQAAVINGMIALKENHESYGFLNCGMGCGKTIMAMATVEGAVNRKWLRQHPGKTLKDMYLLPKSEQPKYRAVVMPPGHLTEKWRREILREIPNATVTMVKSLTELEELREEGRKPSGREWFVIGKDFAKLDSGQGPTPTKIVTRKAGRMFCERCKNISGFLVPMKRDRKGRCTCSSCGTTDKKDFRFYEIHGREKETGLLCPDCGQMLIRKDAKDDDDFMALKPTDFATKTTQNDFCVHCGASLWGTRVKPNGELKPLIWQKLSFRPGKNGKGTAQTNFVYMQKGLNGTYPWLEAFYAKKGLYDHDGKLEPVHQAHIADVQYSPRKVAPATFIKKYLDGYWDFVILDEVHKYAGAGSAQMQAAHALVKTGKFTLGLTGTLTNGTAQSLFYLFWMLCPWVMKGKGYRFASSAKFSQEYGCTEALYEEGSSFSNYARLRKGRQITPPRVKPGINPVVYSEFLLGHAINMDLSDLSSHMPPLVEKVELIPMNDDQKRAYGANVSTLNSAVKDEGGGCLLGEMLNFSLSYPDKPYGRMPIKHPKTGALVMNPENLDIYRTGLLPKEERVVEIVKDELEEGRNCFIFATFTGNEETCVTGRLKDIIERECNLTGRVAVLEASKPKAEEREEFIHRQAKAGIQVVITNAKICETGLDFCWDEDGIFYNYPTILFVQPTYELATMMQASRRHYRLNQKEECRTYWMAYEGTSQASALQIMASKQVAAAAIQGSFSAEGLASMAQGVDPRVMLAKKLADGDNSSREELAGMFDVIAKTNAAAAQEDEDVEKQPLFFEIMGTDYHDGALDEGTKMQEDILTLTLDDIREIKEEKPAVPEPESAEVKKGGKKKKNRYEGSGDIFDITGITLEAVSFDFVVPFEGELLGRKKKVKKMSGQIDLLDLLAV